MSFIPFESTVPVYQSAVAIIETPGQADGRPEFLLEQRPDLSHTDMCNPGTMQLFGGHRNPAEPPWRAVRREIGEETTPPAKRMVLTKNFERGGRLTGVLLGTVPWEASRRKPLEDGGSALIQKRFLVSLFRVWVPEGYSGFELSDTEIARGTAIARVDATLDTVEAAKGQLANFSYHALRSVLQGTPMQGNIDKEHVWH